MKKEARLLLDKGVNSLILGIENFNRLSDRGRVDSVLIFLDHSFEMLLKAAILHKGGKIREKNQKQTIGFDECVRKCFSDGKIQFLSKEQVLTVQTLNSLRDAAQHHLVSLSENILYVHSQSALTLFRDIYKTVFGRDISKELPDRILPISTKPPLDIATLFEIETSEIKQMLRPGTRKNVEAFAKLRGLSILEQSIHGKKVQPGVNDLKKLSTGIKRGASWDQIFPGVASIQLTAKGYGQSLDLRISKIGGLPVQLVPPGTPGATVVAVKKVDELGFYHLNTTQLSKKCNLTVPRMLAVIRFLNIQSDAECFKEFIIGKSKYRRYSVKALDKIREALPSISVDEIWKKYSQMGYIPK